MDKTTARVLIETTRSLLNATLLKEYQDARWEMSVQRQALFIKYASKKPELILYTPITKQLSELPKKVLESLLCFNSQSEKTVGVFVSMTQPQGALLLMIHVSLSDLDANSLRKIAIHLFNKNIVWQGMIKKMPDSSTSNVMRSPLEATIRV